MRAGDRAPCRIGKGDVLIDGPFRSSRMIPKRKAAQWGGMGTFFELSLLDTFCFEAISQLGGSYVGGGGAIGCVRTLL